MGVVVAFLRFESSRGTLQGKGKILEPDEDGPLFSEKTRKPILVLLTLVAAYWFAYSQWSVLMSLTAKQAFGRSSLLLVLHPEGGSVLWVPGPPAGASTRTTEVSPDFCFWASGACLPGSSYWHSAGRPLRSSFTWCSSRSEKPWSAQRLMKPHQSFLAAQRSGEAVGLVGTISGAASVAGGGALTGWILSGAGATRLAGTVGLFAGSIGIWRVKTRSPEERTDHDNDYLDSLPAGSGPGSCAKNEGLQLVPVV